MRPAPVAGPARRSATERQPKYLRIYTELRDRIIGGQWPAGSSLPAQRELADEFGVSMMTLRQALQLLADEGLVGTRHGLGTYVTPRFAHDLGHLRSFASDLAAQGAEVTTRLLDAAEVAPPDAVGARLGGPARVLRLRRLRLVGGRPVILQASYLPVPLPGGLDPRDLAGPGDRGLYTQLEERGLAVARAAETISPAVLTAADARDLGRPAGSPALLSHRLSFTAAGDPVIDDHALLPGDSVAITANRSADQIEVSYALAAVPPAAS
ncbi:MAG TPA: GntR family transcriptional regulator [Streptosporangiaceae bacterium]|nr:GntR family transcriptional regulator [Streptosporangiaceae bacterium]